MMDMPTLRRARLEACGGLRGAGLEIGAFLRPTVNDPSIEMKYLDFYSTEELRRQAVQNGDDPGQVVHVDYVAAGEDYRSVVDRTFDFIIANHVFEHIVNPIAWLQMMSELLGPRGHLLLTLPDKKYSFDRYRDDTAVSHLFWDYFADVPLEAKARVHAFDTSIFYDRAYIKQTITPEQLFNPERINKTQHHPGVHCHVFQGETFLRRIMKPLLCSKLIDYTLADFNEKSPWGEFNVVLRKGWTPFAYELSDFYESSPIVPRWARASPEQNHEQSDADVPSEAPAASPSAPAASLSAPPAKLLRSAWKRLPLPVSVRRMLAPPAWRALEGLAMGRLRRKSHDATPGPVYVAGLFSESHGIAASAIRCAEALEALGLETHRVDLGELSHLALIERPSKTYPPGGAWIVHANAPEFVVALATIGPEAFAHSFLAGYWAWELPDAPLAWKSRMALADEIWAPSLYTARALGAGVRVVPHPQPRAPSLSRAEARALLALPADRFIAATLFDFRSSLARKNPLGALEAFRRAFGEDESALLIIKAQHGEDAPALSALLREQARGPNIRVIDEVWPSDRAGALIVAADALVSLHRAEGFGLTLAEAMAAGTAVIATAWSGNLDFMAPDYEGLAPASETPVEDAQSIYAGQYWASPDLQRAAQLLQRLRGDAEWRRALEETGRRLVRERLGLDAFRNALSPRFWASVRR